MRGVIGFRFSFHRQIQNFAANLRGAIFHHFSLFRLQKFLKKMAGLSFNSVVYNFQFLSICIFFKTFYHAGKLSFPKTKIFV